MFGFLLKILVCILVVFCIHMIWQKVQENYIRPKIKNKNAEIEKYKSLVENISRQNQNKSHNISLSREREEEDGDRCKLPKPNIELPINDLESDLNSFLDSILVENHIEIMPVVM